MIQILAKIIAQPATSHQSCRQVPKQLNVRILYQAAPLMSDWDAGEAMGYRDNCMRGLTIRQPSAVLHSSSSRRAAAGRFRWGGQSAATVGCPCTPHREAGMSGNIPQYDNDDNYIMPGDMTMSLKLVYRSESHKKLHEHKSSNTHACPTTRAAVLQINSDMDQAKKKFRASGGLSWGPRSATR